MPDVVQNLGQVCQEIIIVGLKMCFKDILSNLIFYLAILSQKAFVHEVKKAVLGKVYFSRSEGT